MSIEKFLNGRIAYAEFHRDVAKRQRAEAVLELRQRDAEYCKLLIKNLSLMSEIARLQNGH